MGNKLSPISKKITLVEIDLSQESPFWSNWTAGVWYVDFDMVYDRIDPALLVGAPPPMTGIYVGSVRCNAVSMTQVASVALVESTDSSFYFDITDRRLYIHLPGGDEPSAHYVLVGVTQGASNHAGYYNGIYYEPRVQSPPVFNKTKDPLYFGRISIDSLTFNLNNDDGFYNQLGENGAALWGTEVRVLQGFDDDAYAAFERLFTGYIEGLRVSDSVAALTAIDKRSGLSRSVPVNDFTLAAYPYLASRIVGLPIPLAYGVLDSVLVRCTNDLETTPSYYHFKIADTAGAGHSIKAVSTVYVNGKSVSFTNLSLANATFDIAAALYTPNDVVTANITGFEISGTAITSPADIIIDLLDTWLDITYTSPFYNTTEWAATKTNIDAAYPSGAGLFVDKAVDVFIIIQQLCASFLLSMIPEDAGTFTLRVYDSSRSISQVLSADELMGVPSIEYDTSQVITSATVNYNRRWSTGDFVRLRDDSRELAGFQTFGKYRDGEFDTLIVDDADAQTFSDEMQDLQGEVLRTFDATFKMQPFDREIMDFVSIDLSRATKSILGVVTAEIIGKQVVASQGVVLTCRLIT